MLTVVLGVAIGLAFVFLLFSLFLSTALEAVAALLKLRGRALRVAIARLVDDPAYPPGSGFGLVDQYLAPGYESLTRRLGLRSARPAAAGADATLTADAADPDAPEFHEAATESPDGDHLAPRPLDFAAVYAHPLVAGAQAKCMPSYVSAANFSSALLHVLRNDAGGSAAAAMRERIAALPAGQLREALQSALQEADDDLGGLRHGVERWYEHAMDRLSGEYKRFSQAATFIAALVLAVTYNIDAVAIGQRLYVDQDLREALVTQATRYIEDATPAEAAASPPSVGAVSAAALASDAAAASPARAASTPAVTTLADLEAKLRAAREARTKLLQAVPNSADDKDPYSLVGWLITALAGMLGAPFWFDVLQKLVSLRGTGPKPVPATTKAGDVR